MMHASAAAVCPLLRVTETSLHRRFGLIKVTNALSWKRIGSFPNLFGV